ncbi:MAG: [protein-PII] uridylyltransferase [Nitrospirae bacterium]|nr:[protein-PII] uridylyltransferase [Nitrospirota bacterium]
MEIRELSQLLDKGYGGRQLTSHFTEKIDAIIGEAFCAGADSGPGPSPLCLIAVGGYGRRELAPFSDIDVMLFARDRSASKKAEEALYRLWGTNLDISHSFRTAADCISEAKKDIRTKTSLLEHRFIAGDSDLYQYFREEVYPEIAFRNQRSFVTEKLREVEVRHRKFGDSVFMLEPNVKEGKGGLRDAHTVLWVASAAFRVRQFEELTKILTPYDFHRLRKAYDFLLKVRFSLHLLSGRKNDTLSFEFHERVAELLAFRPSRKFYAAERFMRYLYLKASIIHDTASHALDVCSLPYVHLPEAIMKKKVTRNFFVSKDRVVSTADISGDADLILEAFYAMSRTGKKFSPKLRADIRKNLFRITRKARNSPRAVEWFMEIIRGDRVYETLSEMHRCGVLGRFLPEFGALSFLVVYEPYHRYAVDEHSLQAVRKLEELGRTKYRNLEHHAAIFRKIRHREALILSLLLHDIGKRGITRDSRLPDTEKRHHEGEGYVEIKNVMERFNLDIRLRNRVEFLVKNHTLLASVAFKRETDDPEVIAQVADEVLDRENLDALYLLTYADMAAVGPDFWTEWKGYLLRELYETSSRVLDGFAEKGPGQIERMLSLSKGEKERMKEFLSLMPARYLLSTSPEKIHADYCLSRDVATRDFAVRVEETGGGTAEVTVGAWDSPGLFSRIVGVLSSLGMNIYRARVYTGRNGLVIDRLQVANWDELWWEGLTERIGENLSRAVTAELAPESEIHGGEARVSSEVPGFYGRFVPFVELDNETSGEYSILEFFARDRIGLLYDAASMIHEKGIDIISARINTEAGLARDVFSVQKEGAQIHGPLVTDLLAALWERLR